MQRSKPLRRQVEGTAGSLSATAAAGPSIRLSGSQEPGRFAYRAFGSSLGSHSAHRPPFLLQAKELLDAPSGTTLTQLADVEYDCDDLASEAAEVSTSEDAALKLLKV